MHPTPNEIQVAAAELDRLIFKNQKQEKIYIYRRQCPVTNGNRSSGEAEEKEGVAGGGELINYLHLLRDQRVGSAGRTAAIPLPWLPRRCRDFCELRGAPIPVSQYNRTQLSTADVEEIEVIGIAGQGIGWIEDCSFRCAQNWREKLLLGLRRKKEVFYARLVPTPNPRERQTQIKVSKLLAITQISNAKFNFSLHLQMPGSHNSLSSEEHLHRPLNPTLQTLNLFYLFMYVHTCDYYLYHLCILYTFNACVYSYCL